MNITEKPSPALLNMTISDFLQDNGRGSGLLRKLGLPVEGHEDKTLMEVCTKFEMNEDDVLREINRFKDGAEFEYPEGMFNWSPELVVRYLEEEHHNYTRSLVKEAEDYGNRAWNVHGTQYPELTQVKWYVQNLNEKLEMHLNFEEQKFFPKALRFFEMNGDTIDGTVQSLKKQIQIIEDDQEKIEYFIQRIRDLTDHFTPPEGACTTFRLLYSNLEKLSENLEKHHFLEEQYILSRLKLELQN